VIAVGFLVAACATVPSPQTAAALSAAPPVAASTPTSPSPTSTSQFTYSWVRGSIEGAAARTEISDVFVLPGAALAVERSLDGGALPHLVRSEDGATWVGVPLPSPGFAIDGGAVVDGELTLLGHTGHEKRPARQVWTTTDGLAWSEIDQGEAMRFGQPGGYSALVRSTAGWIAQAYEIIDAENAEDHVFVSADRRAWREVTLPGSMITTIASNGSTFAYVGVEVASTPQSTLTWTSADGETWISRPFPELPDDDGVTAIAGAGTGFAVTGQHFVRETEASQPLGWWSSDGSAWEPSSFAGLEGPAGEAAPRAMWVSPAGLVAHGNGDPLRNALWTSADGRQWTQVTPLPDEAVEGVVFSAWPDGRVLLFGRVEDGEPAVWLGTAHR
jgi:hypothetical protein